MNPQVEQVEQGEAVEETPSSGRLGLIGRFQIIEILAAAVAVVIVAALAFSIIEWRSDHSKVSGFENQQSLEKTAVQAASSYAVYLSTYNYTNLNGPSAPWTKVDQHSTPAFKTKYDQTKAALAKLVQSYKATANGVVKAAAPVSVVGNKAVVLIFLDQTISNSAQSSPSHQPFVVELTLDRQHGQWLIEDFNALQ